MHIWGYVNFTRAGSTDRIFLPPDQHACLRAAHPPRRWPQWLWRAGRGQARIERAARGVDGEEVGVLGSDIGDAVLGEEGTAPD